MSDTTYIMQNTVEICVSVCQQNLLFIFIDMMLSGNDPRADIFAEISTQQSISLYVETMYTFAAI